MTTARPEPAQHPESRPDGAPELRLSVWATAQRDARAQRRGRYLPESTAHPAKMLPAIAATAIRRYTKPGDLVADPMCGIGTTLVEAVHLGRDGLGIEYEDRWAQVAAANVAHARRQGAAGTAEVIRGDARQLAALLPPGMAGRAALVVTSPPYGPSVHGQVKAEQRHGQDGGVRKYDNRYSQDPANLAHQGLDELLAGFTAILAGCAALLRPGGLAVVTARPWRQHGELVDLPAAVIAAGASAGLIPVARCVALLAGLRSGRLIARPSFLQLDNLRRARRHGQPWHLIVHEDILIFRAPIFPGGSRELRGPQGEPKGALRRLSHVAGGVADGLGAAA
jgi:modification methylase